MDDNQSNEDTSTYPALGRWMTWVDKPGSDKILFWLLVAACVIVFLLDFTFKSKGYFDIEKAKGFYAIYGFVMFTGLIFAATGLRKIIKRDEDYYGDKSINAEDYPETQLERRDHDV